MAIGYLQQLDALGISSRSYTEPYLNTESELVRHILLGVLSDLAELEAKKISRRTKAGLERARAEGKSIGQPSKFEEHRGDLEAMIEEDCSKAEMKRRIGLAYFRRRGNTFGASRASADLRAAEGETWSR